MKVTIYLNTKLKLYLKASISDQINDIGRYGFPLYIKSDGFAYQISSVSEVSKLPNSYFNVPRGYKVIDLNKTINKSKENMSVTNSYLNMLKDAENGKPVSKKEMIQKQKRMMEQIKKMQQQSKDFAH